MTCSIVRLLTLCSALALAAAIPAIPQLPDRMPLTLITPTPLPGVKSFADRVRQAALDTYVEGMTQAIADQLGPDAVPILKQLLADTSFPRHDNVVAFLTYLANDDDTAALLMRLAQSTPAADRSPEDDRAFLLAPHALGYMAQRGSIPALNGLLQLSSPSAAGAAAAMDPALLEQALFGLARSGKPQAMVRLGELAKLGVGSFMGRRAILALNENSPSAIPQDLVLKAQSADVSVAPAVQAAGSVAAAAAATSFVTYCNHPEVTSKMTDATLDAVLAAGSALVQTANPAYSGDVACSVGFSRLGSAGVFGSSGDGLASIDTSAELTTTLNSGCAWIKVVRLINYCGGSGTNIIGCGWIGGTGVAVVRYTALGNNGEGTLWVHEMGHNAGLNHLSVTGNIMYPSVNTVGGLTAAQCTAYTNLASSHTCFPASARVRVNGKGLVPIANLVQGDKIADAHDQDQSSVEADVFNNSTSTAATSTSEFIAYLHAESQFTATFVAIKHERGVLKATPDHYIFKVDPVTMQRTAIRAQDMKSGDYVLAETTAAASESSSNVVMMTPSKVLATSLVREQGIFAPLTESGSLIVDGVLSSCYADVVSASSHDASHLSMLPLRWLYKTFPSLADKSPSAELHWYATMLMKLISSPGISSLLQ